MADTEQIKQLKNQVIIHGVLAEIQVFEGDTKNGVPYISIQGKIKFGESSTEILPFKSFAQAIKSDGSKSKQYLSFVDFADKAVSMVDAAQKKDLQPTMVSIYGGLIPNDFYASSGELIQTCQIRVSNFNEFKPVEENPSNAIVNLDCYIKAIADETKGEDKIPTGRKRMTLVSTDSFKNALVLKNVIIPADMVDDFEETYNIGDTALLFFGYYLHKSEAKKKKAGIGRQRVTEGKDYLELVLEGGDVPYEEDKDIISPKVLKAWMTERENKLAQLEEEHENGGGSKSVAKSSTTGRRSGINKTAKSSETDNDYLPMPSDDDDEIPF